MHRDNHDFFDHPHRPRLSPWLYLPAVLILSLAIAAWWADTNSAATWRANGLAEQQSGRTGP